MQARYVIGPDDIIAYADIDVDYRSEPELSAVLLVLQRLRNATSSRTSPMKREIIRVELLSAYLENWKAPISAVTAVMTRFMSRRPAR